MGVGGFDSPESVPPVGIRPPPSRNFVATPLAVHLGGCPALPYVRRHPVLPDQEPIFLKIDASSFVELKRRVWSFFLQFANKLFFKLFSKHFSTEIGLY